MRKWPPSSRRREPIENASHVRDAIARFTQVEGVTDEEREVAWQRILAEARQYDVGVAQPTRNRRRAP